MTRLIVEIEKIEGKCVVSLIPPNHRGQNDGCETGFPLSFYNDALFTYFSITMKCGDEQMQKFIFTGWTHLGFSL